MGFITQAKTGPGVKGISFDGASYLAKGADLTGNADGKVGTFSAFIKLDAVTTHFIYHVTSSRFVIQISTLGGLIVQGQDSAGGAVLDLRSSVGQLVPSGLYTHACASWDLANNLGHVYIGDTEVEAAETIVNTDIEYTRTSHAIGAAVSAALFTQGNISEFYLNLAEYVDLSVEANRRKFISSSGSSVSLGSDGSLPTGTAPIIYMPGNNAGTNLGTGGDFTATGAPIVTTGPSGSSGDKMVIPTWR